LLVMTERKKPVDTKEQHAHLKWDR
jgi:hypothetical protein